MNNQFEMNGFEQQVDKLYTEATGSQCALDQLYGGMPGAGGFEANTEYEVGVQRIAEAAHCILGSAGKVWNSQRRGETDTGFRFEKGHFNEEMGIIDKSIREYSKPIYDGRTFLSSRFRFDSLDSMQRTAPKLLEQARRNRRLLDRDKDQYDPRLYEIAWWSYTVLKDLAEAVADSVQGATEQPVRNAFRDVNLRGSARVLRGKIERAYE